MPRKKKRFQPGRVIRMNRRHGGILRQYKKVPGKGWYVKRLSLNRNFVRLKRKPKFVKKMYNIMKIFYFY